MKRLFNKVFIFSSIFFSAVAYSECFNIYRDANGNTLPSSTPSGSTMLLGPYICSKSDLIYGKCSQNPDIGNINEKYGVYYYRVTLSNILTNTVSVAREALLCTSYDSQNCRKSETPTIHTNGIYSVVSKSGRDLTFPIEPKHDALAVLDSGQYVKRLLGSYSSVGFEITRYGIKFGQEYACEPDVRLVNAGGGTYLEQERYIDETGHTYSFFISNTNIGVNNISNPVTAILGNTQVTSIKVDPFLYHASISYKSVFPSDWVAIPGSSGPWLYAFLSMHANTSSRLRHTVSCNTNKINNCEVQMGKISPTTLPNSPSTNDNDWYSSSTTSSSLIQTNRGLWVRTRYTPHHSDKPGAIDISVTVTSEIL